MKIKKFEGTEINEVLKAIKLELGEEAVILSTREVKRRALIPEGGFKTIPVVEITAAIDLEVFEQPVEAEVSAPFETTLKQAIQGDLYKELQQIKSSLASLKQGHEERVTSGAHAHKQGPSEEASEKNIHETWLEMKIMLKSLSDLQNANKGAPQENTLVRLHEQLMMSGVDSTTAQHLVQAVTEELSQEALWKPSQVQQSIQKIIEGLVQVTGPFHCDETDASSGPKVVALIGPTGVGKTTTIAKLGVEWKKQKRPVTLVSLIETQTQNIDPLNHYADQHGLPAVKVASWRGLGRLVAQREKGELILVDTSGRSHLNPGEVRILKGLTSLEMPLETHLVLSANIKGCDLSEMIDRFSVIPIDSLLFTKMDETQRYGPLLSAMGRKRKPVSYFTTGRQVPDDIEAATAKRFTDLMLKNAMQPV